MKLSNLEPASDLEVKQWLMKSLDLSVYQKEILSRDEIVRFSKFEFYKQRKRIKTPPIWRLTLPLYPIFLLLLIIGNLFKWVITGKSGYNQKFLDKYLYSWQRKLNL